MGFANFLNEIVGFPPSGPSEQQMQPLGETCILLLKDPLQELCEHKSRYFCNYFCVVLLILFLNCYILLMHIFIGVPGNPALRHGKPGSGIGLGYGLRFKSQFGHFQVDYAMNGFQQKTVYFSISNLASWMLNCKLHAVCANSKFLIESYYIAVPNLWWSWLHLF